MGSLFFDLAKLVNLKKDGLHEYPFSKDYLPVTGAVLLEGESAGTVDFQLRLRTISKEADQMFRRRKEGNQVEVDPSFGLDATSLIILSEEMPKSTSKSFLHATSSALNPANIFSQGSIKGFRPFRSGVSAAEGIRFWCLSDIQIILQRDY